MITVADKRRRQLRRLPYCSTPLPHAPAPGYPLQAAVVRAGPDAALGRLDEPIPIDEWQLVPEILGAVKRAPDDDSRRARFVLTGSRLTRLTGW